MSEQRRRRALRARGWADGIAGRRASSPDVDYQISWRRGHERRVELQDAARPEPPPPPRPAPVGLGIGERGPER